MWVAHRKDLEEHLIFLLSCLFFFFLLTILSDLTYVREHKAQSFSEPEVLALQVTEGCLSMGRPREALPQAARTSHWLQAARWEEGSPVAATVGLGLA